MPKVFRILAFSLLISAIGLAAASHLTSADSSPESEIRAVLETQTDAWNHGDIDIFMTGYWKSDQTVFVGAKGLTRGYQAVLERYRKTYPDRQTMGQLTFSDLEIHVLCPDTAFAIGQFHLKRENDAPSGIFTLDFKKFPEGWRIVLDHSTAFAVPAH